jgi:hypothetical protein
MCLIFYGATSVQLQLPIIPAGATQITKTLSVECVGDKWRYRTNMDLVFEHHKDDKASFRMITSSFILLGNCKNSDIQRVFSVSKSSVIRYKNKYREYGASAFFKKKQKS